MARLELATPAEAKAGALLRSRLSAAQWLDFAKTGRFTEHIHGRDYRFYGGSALVTTLVPPHERPQKCHWECFAPCWHMDGDCWLGFAVADSYRWDNQYKRKLPKADELVIQLVCLRADPEMVWYTSCLNIQGTPGWPSNCDKTHGYAYCLDEDCSCQARR